MVDLQWRGGGGVRSQMGYVALGRLGSLRQAGDAESEGDLVLRSFRRRRRRPSSFPTSTTVPLQVFLYLVLARCVSRLSLYSRTADIWPLHSRRTLN